MNSIQSIPKDVRENFSTLCDAVQADRICLLSVFDSTQGKPATVVCTVNYHEYDDQPYELIPLAMMFEENPYARFVPPFSNVGYSHD